MRMKELESLYDAFLETTSQVINKCILDKNKEIKKLEEALQDRNKKIKQLQFRLAVSGKDKKKEQKTGGQTFTDLRDGKVYKTVRIGNKIWMAENLAYEGVNHYCPDNDRANVKKYGYLYEWEDAKKACPPGWRLPTKEEFEKLLELTSADDGNSCPLRDKTWEEGSNSIGFSALPAGLDIPGNYNYFGYSGYWWSDTEVNSFNAYAMYLDNSGAGIYDSDKTIGFSVRCVKEI